MSANTVKNFLELEVARPRHINLGENLTHQAEGGDFQEYVLTIVDFANSVVAFVSQVLPCFMSSPL